MRTAQQEQWVSASQTAGRHEIAALQDCRERAVLTMNRAGYSVSEVSEARSLDENRELLRSAEQQATVLRSELREVRRLCKAIAERTEREKNGRFIA